MPLINIKLGAAEKLSDLLGSFAKKRGLAPGTILGPDSGSESLAPAKLKLFHYDEKGFEESNLDADSLSAEKIKGGWLNFVGIHDRKLASELGSQFKIHPLILEDVVNLGQRPKMEDYESSVFVTLKMFHVSKLNGSIEIEQISFVLGPDYLISFQEDEEDVFEPIRQRIREGRGKIRRRGLDYLLYTLIDAIVDDCFVCLEVIGNQIEDLQNRVSSKDDQGVETEISQLRNQLLSIRRVIQPTRDMLVSLSKPESTQLIKKDTCLFFRDALDHASILNDATESYREALSTIADFYFSKLSQKLNETMRVLTVFASIFIPLTFIVGIYGMNFKNIPELEWDYGYHFVWALMIAVAVAMLILIKKKRWM